MTVPIPLDPPRRRAALATSPNPAPRHDYVVSLTSRFAATDGKTLSLELRYVPDRFVMQADSLTPYFDSVSAAGCGLEEIAIAVLEDVNNEVVPRWIEVSVTADEGGIGRRVTLQDRQPHWDNPPLLARIPTR